MNRNLLIDAIVRQTMVLIAQLATAAGARTPLAHVANQVFLDLVTELQNAGLGQKIIADMFGMALRTYHERIRRLSESATDRGRTLWEAVLEHIRSTNGIARGEILRRFRRDDPLMVRSVLSDLVDTGLVFRSGRGDRTTFRAAEAELVERVTRDDEEVASTMVWVTIHRRGPCTHRDIVEAVGIDDHALDGILKELVESGRARREESAGQVVYTAPTCVIPYEDDAGWEAAVFDHFQAVVTAISTKLNDAPRARLDDSVGGSTYTFDIWKGHPKEAEVTSFLRSVREQASSLRAEVDKTSADDNPPGQSYRVTFYAGQLIPVHDDSPNE